jgi:hypothetical protein
LNHEIFLFLLIKVYSSLMKAHRKLMTKHSPKLSINAFKINQNAAKNAQKRKTENRRPSAIVVQLN